MVEVLPLTYVFDCLEWGVHVVIDACEKSDVQNIHRDGLINVVSCNIIYGRPLVHPYTGWVCEDYWTALEAYHDVRA